MQAGKPQTGKFNAMNCLWDNLMTITVPLQIILICSIPFRALWVEGPSCNQFSITYASLNSHGIIGTKARYTSRLNGLNDSTETHSQIYIETWRKVWIVIFYVFLKSLDGEETITFNICTLTHTHAYTYVRVYALVKVIHIEATSCIITFPTRLSGAFY